MIMEQLKPKDMLNKGRMNMENFHNEMDQQQLGRKAVNKDQIFDGVKILLIAKIEEHTMELEGTFEEARDKANS